jgi:hypothetical protein
MACIFVTCFNHMTTRLIWAATLKRHEARGARIAAQALGANTSWISFSATEPPFRSQVWRYFGGVLNMADYVASRAARAATSSTPRCTTFFSRMPVTWPLPA